MLAGLVAEGCRQPAKPAPRQSWALVRPTKPEIEDLAVTPQPKGPPVSRARERIIARQLVAALRSEWPRIRNCYDIASRRLPTSHSGLSVRFELNADGSVAQTEVLKASGWPAVALCVQDVVSSVPFPELDQDVAVEYEMGLEAEPADDTDEGGAP